MSTTFNTILDEIDPATPSISWDRFQVKTYASSIKNLFSQLRTAEFYIAVGEKFDMLHRELTKKSPKDVERLGWEKAFSKAENKFDMSCRQAERYMVIYKAFYRYANSISFRDLPQGFRALHKLAELEFAAARLKECIEKKLLAHDTNEAGVRKIAKHYNVDAPKAPKTSGTKKPKQAQQKKIDPVVVPFKNAPRRDRIAAVLAFIDQLGLTTDDILHELEPQKKRETA